VISSVCKLFSPFYFVSNEHCPVISWFSFGLTIILYGMRKRVRNTFAWILIRATLSVVRYSTIGIERRPVRFGQTGTQRLKEIGIVSLDGIKEESK